MQAPPDMNHTSMGAGTYALLGGEALIMALAIAYLILSKGNTLTFGQTLRGSKRKIALAAIAVVLAGGITAADVALANNSAQQGPPTQTEQQDQNSVSAKGVKTVDGTTEELDGTYDSTEEDTSSILVTNGGSMTLDGASVTKTGDSTSSEDSDFYGLNAAALAYDGSTLTLSGADISTDSKGSNGVFAYGEGTTVNVSDTTITCKQGNSGGVELAGGATLNASNLTVDTQGESSASIRSDRGGGTETVNGGTYTTHGKHSPAVYSTADVTVNDATLLAENCEVVVIEGLNSVALNNVDATANVNNVATRTGISNAIMIYQSMSGDAEVGTGSFSMTGGSLKNTSDTLFYSTNTTAQIALEGVQIDNAGKLLVAAGNDGQWGTAGSNGSDVTLNAKAQVLAGDITVDDISSLVLSLAGNSSYTGAINADGQAGDVSVTLEAGSTWTLTGDSYITSLDGDTAGIDLNGHTLYVNGQAWTA